MAGGVLSLIGIGLIVVGVALPFWIFNTDSEDGAEAFGSVIVGIVAMMVVSPILILAGIILVVMGIIRWTKGTRA